jgi:hypothetical protein
MVVLGVAQVAAAATVTIDSPTQGEEVASGPCVVKVSLSEDFVLGQDGWVEIWVDGNWAAWFKETTGIVPLSPGSHQIQARLVNVYHQPLRVPAVSDRVQVIVPSVDPSGGD